MAAYLSTLTDNLLVIGAIPALTAGLWGLGSLLAPGTGSSGRTISLISSLAAVAQAGLLAAITWVAFLDNRSTGDLLRWTLILYGVFGFAGGVAASTRNVAIDRRVGPTARAGLFRSRAMLAALLMPLAGFVTYQVLADPGLVTQRAFAYLFLAATAALSASAFLTILIQSRVSPDGLAAMRFPTAQSSKGTTSTIRSLALFRFVLAAAALGDVFLVVFAINELGMPLRYLGSAVVVFGVSLFLLQPVLRRIANRRGGRAALQIAAAAKIIPPLVALALPYVLRSDTYNERVTDDRYVAWVVVGSFACIAVALAAVSAGGYRYLEDSIPVRSRAEASRVINVALILGAVAALGGGLVADRWGLDIAFATATGVGLLAIILSGTLSDVRGESAIPLATKLSQSSGYRSIRLGRN